MVKWQGFELWITVRRGQRHPVPPRQGCMERLSQPEPPGPARWWGQKVHAWHLLFLLGMVGAAVMWEYSYAEHVAVLHWMSGYKSADGVGCCSERDCLPLPIAVLQLTGDQATVRDRGNCGTAPGQIRACHARRADLLVLPDQCARAMSHKEPSRATTRCVFYATGM